ncbi:hypothetical protein LTR35_005289 [Friedmanniomyces endolithicus]|nr:hypothetical protein LTR35_005289 [Friedmanniomyces endolithicus]KAK1019162.1 hypothetical protein LTR54_000977 [Friedmanniomyces endolithicus]
MLALIYVGLFAVIGFFARLDITQTALFSFPTFAKMLDAPPPHSGVLSDSSVITATPDDDAVTIVWRDMTTRKFARPPTSAKTEGSAWVSRLCAERAASVAGEEQQKKKKKKKQPLRACWKGERAKQEKPALRSAVHWEGVEEEGTPAGGPLQVPRTVDAAESAAGVASGADGGKRADPKAPDHAGGDGRATPRSTVSPAVEVKSGKAPGSTTAPGGGGGVEKAKRGVVIRGTRGGRSARGGSGVSAESRRWRVGKKCQRNQLERQCELVATWKRHELLCGRLAARRQRHAATSAPPPPPPATPHSASVPAAPAQARIGGPMSWEPTDDAVDALALDLADMNFLAPGEHALDMEDVAWHSTAPTHPGDIIMAETLPNPAPASGLAAPPAGDVCMADVTPNGAPDVQMADAVVAKSIPIAMQAVGAALALPICFYRAPMPAQQLPQAQAAWPSQEVQTAQVAQAVSQEVQAAQAVQAVRVQDVQAYVAAQVPTIHQAPMPAQQQRRTNRLAGAARKQLGGSPLRSMSNARPTPAKVSADVTPGPTEHEMYCPRENCGQITWKSMATCKVCKEKKPGAETATYAIPGDHQPHGNE